MQRQFHCIRIDKAVISPSLLLVQEKTNMFPLLFLFKLYVIHEIASTCWYMLDGVIIVSLWSQKANIFLVIFYLLATLKVFKTFAIVDKPALKYIDKYHYYFWYLTWFSWTAEIVVTLRFNHYATFPAPGKLLDPNNISFWISVNWLNRWMVFIKWQLL